MGSTSILETQSDISSNPRITYSQLMIAAHKAHDKIRARSAMTTEPVESPTELGNQIAKLMAVLIGQERATAPPAPQIVPDREAMGEERWTGALLATPAPIMAKLVWDRLPQSAVHLSDVVQGPPLLEARDQTPKHLKKAPQTQRPQFPPVLQVPQFGSHGSGM